MNPKNVITALVAIAFLATSYSGWQSKIHSNNSEVPTSASATTKLYEVTKVVDGDTIDVSLDGKIDRVRFIGINTPETVDPRKTVECFGVEASNYVKLLLEGKQVTLEADSSQGDRDKYGRLLRYVSLSNGANLNLLMIKGGYAHEYTYDIPYKYQTEFKTAEKLARETKAGLWGDKCQTNSTAVNTTLSPLTKTVTPLLVGPNGCTIKGNINTKGEKIYHMQGCGSYNRTVISPSQGERWFCSEDEAHAAGWRKAGNCN